MSVEFRVIREGPWYDIPWIVEIYKDGFYTGLEVGMTKRGTLRAARRRANKKKHERLHVETVTIP